MASALTPFTNELTRSVASQFNARRADPDVKWATEKAYAMQIIANSEQLIKCRPKSVVSALMTIANMGLTLSPERRHAYLIPRRPRKGAEMECYATPSYMGLEYLARQTEEVANIHTDLVYKNDAFERGTDRNGPWVDHAPARENRGPLQLAFCMTWYANGHRGLEVMTAADLVKVENAAIAAQNGSMPPSWKFWGDEMRKKSVTRRASKHWPISSARFHRAVTAMDEAEPVDVSNPDGLLMSERQAAGIRKLAEDLKMDADRAMANICASFGVDELTDIAESQVQRIRKGLQKRAKVAA